jgi:hypothetical protein
MQLEITHMATPVMTPTQGANGYKAAAPRLASPAVAWPMAATAGRL